MKTSSQIKHFLTHRSGKIILGVLALLIIARAMLPFAVKSYVNRVLDQAPDYDGSIGDVDIHLWRGAYTIQEVQIVKTSGKSEIPFFKAHEVDLSISWKELFQGQVVALVRFDEPEINFVDSSADAKKQTGKNQSWKEMLNDLVPFRISRLTVRDGAVHLWNLEASPQVNVWIKNMQAELTNLTNSEKLGETLFAKLNARGTALGNGELTVDVAINPNSEKPTFDLNGKLMSLDLKELNPFFKKYADLDFEAGQADIVSEIAVSEGKLKGYIKPIFRRLHVFSLKKEIERDKDSIFTIAWEALVGLVAQVLKNQPKDQFATRIPISGSLQSTDVDVFATISGVLKNAFISAFRPFYDNSIALKSK